MFFPFDPACVQACNLDHGAERGLVAYNDGGVPFRGCTGQGKRQGMLLLPGFCVWFFRLE
jgi:hypothetical protein